MYLLMTDLKDLRTMLHINIVQFYMKINLENYVKSILDYDKVIELNEKDISTFEYRATLH